MTKNSVLLEVKDLSMSFHNEQILHSVSFNVDRNSFMTILGPSGCGKTTLLRLISGFEKPQEGEIRLEGQLINNLPPYKRHLNTVFQGYALFPRLNVFDNIAFGLKIKKVPKDEITERVLKIIKLVNLEGKEYRSLDSISGGQRQRVALARALVNRPPLILLDEPLAALDLSLRKEMQLELKRMQQQLGITFIYITHDQEEALMMSDKIIIMNKGRVQQIGIPTDIYNEPANLFTSKFIGESNIFEGTMIKDCLVSFANKNFECIDSGFSLNSPIYVVLRPEDITITSVEKGLLKGKVIRSTFLGVHFEIEIEENERSWIIHSTNNSEIGSEVGLDFTKEDIHVIPQEEES